MEEFIRSCLKPILSSEVDDEIIQYIKQMKVVDDFDEFIDNVIDRSNPEHERNYKELKNRLFGGSKKTALPASASQKTKHRNNSQRKDPTDAFPSLPNSKSRNETSQQKSNSKAAKHSRTSEQNKEQLTFASTSKTDVTGKQLEQGYLSKGKKTKYVNIESFDSTVGMKKGRHPCNCEARIHALINNCLKCGRIVCEQEGSGPCFFCDSMVCTNEELAVLESNSKQSDKLYNRLKEQKTSKEWKKAIEMRDKLIKADRSGDYKRAIYDDQSDYYAGGDKWKTDGNSAVPRIHKSRTDMKLALDFASRMVILTENEYAKNKENLLKGVNKLLDSTEERFPRNLFETSNDDIHDVSVEDDSKLWEKANEEQSHNRRSLITSKFSKIKVANDAFLSEIDRGLCLSMHQPWASLLVSGIKIHEGRTWYTEHRGRLWIHAAGREPQGSDILEIEKMYRAIYDDPDLLFPRKYPTSCLLGCVFVEDCLSQERYRELYPNGESDSPYVLICTNPMILPVFYPMQGQHKIFPLKKEVHNKAKEGILSAKWL
ncbi:hypothetical protein ILUMI_06955 [Ignelater luminosus]|uniref:ASCH domain-containing protein n=1 Tax=Ignelater luminosus TaxID=2038154 RepID=A0A8K0GGR4_IGNLU|nr:hypothetical protein ILUMI_06955 [Ignelater luminosus]